RLRLTWSEKVGILDNAARTPVISYRDLAEHAVTEFSPPAVPGKTTICSIIKSSAVLLGRPLEKAARKNAQPITHTLLGQNV
ncbi:hypothetical protein PHYSODRAFT_451531, partial [Phytophthora sojae]